MATFVVEIIPKECLTVCISEYLGIDFFFCCCLDNKTQHKEPSRQMQEAG